MSKAVCVFCAAGQKLDPVFYQSARDCGRLMAEKQMSLVYGGGRIGMMGACAESVHEHGGKVVGVIPKRLMHKEIAYEEADELIVTEDLYERKRILIDRADAFVILAGGFGTLDEVMEVITLKQLDMIQQPLMFLNINGYFNALFKYFEEMAAAKTVPAHYKDYYQVFDNVEDMIAAI